jgi:MFS family permease
VVILLPIYLGAIGFGAFEIGLVATLALFGSALVTFAIGFIGWRLDPRLQLIYASALMSATGLAFAFCSSPVLLLLVAFIGTINPSSGSVSIFAPLEQALLSHSVSGTGRTEMFARYGLIGSFAAAIGALAAASPDLMHRLGSRNFGP